MDEPPKPFQLEFGAMASPIPEQLRVGGIQGWTNKQGQRWQALANAITTCYLNGLIPAASAELARKRLCKQIGEGLTK